MRLPVTVLTCLALAAVAAEPVEKGTVHFTPPADQKNIPERYRLPAHRFSYEMKELYDLPISGLSVHHLTFPSPVTSKTRENNTVHAEYYRPHGKGPFPGVIVLDITAGDQSLSRLIAGHLAQNRICGLRSKQDVTKHSARLRGRCFKRVLRWRQRCRHQCQCRQTRRSILAAALPVTAPATCLSLSLCNKWPTRLPAQQIIPMRSPKTQNRAAVGCAPLGNSWEDCGRKRRGWEAGWRLKSLENFADLSAEQRVWRADAGTKKG